MRVTLQTLAIRVEALERRLALREEVGIEEAADVQKADPPDQPAAEEVSSPPDAAGPYRPKYMGRGNGRGKGSGKWMVIGPHGPVRSIPMSKNKAQALADDLNSRGETPEEAEAPEPAPEPAPGDDGDDIDNLIAGAGLE